MTTSIDVADEFLRLASAEGRRLNAISLIKLCVIPNGWSLARTGEPLFGEPIEAWAYGPNVPQLYHALAHWGTRPIERGASGPSRIDRSRAELVKAVHASYGNLPQSALQGLTNRAGTPWAITREDADGPREIPSALTRAHYLALAAERSKKAA